MPRKLISSQQAAEQIGVSISRIQALLRQRRISGARLVGRVWMVPEDFRVTPGSRGPALQRSRS